MESGIWFAWYPVETIDGWVWLEYVNYESDYMGFCESDYIYTKIKESK
mgnify:FL=1